MLSYVLIFTILNIISGYSGQLLLIRIGAQNHISEKSTGLKFYNGNCNSIFNNYFSLLPKFIYTNNIYASDGSECSIFILILSILRDNSAIILNFKKEEG